MLISQKILLSQELNKMKQQNRVLTIAGILMIIGTLALFLG